MSNDLTETVKDAYSIENKSYQTQLDDSLIASIALSVFSFIAAINIRDAEIKRHTAGINRFIVLGLIFLSISFAVMGLVKYTTEFFNDLTGKYRYEFNYTSAIAYTIFVSILIIIELVYAQQVYIHLV